MAEYTPETWGPGDQFTDTQATTMSQQLNEEEETNKTQATKLATIATGATANSTDAFLLARANHTGVQPSSTISDFTEAVQDAVAAVLAAGTGVTLAYDDALNQLTITSTGGGGGLDAEAVRDAIGVAMIGAGLITVTVNDAADTITISTTATANDTDANLKARANHTGTQSADTVIDGATNHVFTAADDTKLTGIATGATANATDAQLRDRATHTGTQSADTLTDGTTNKAFLTTERTKLTGIATGATANATDAQLRDRATHTGTQTAATISDFTTAVQAAGGGATTDVVRTGVYQFEHPNNAVLDFGAISINTRRAFVIPHDVSRFRLHLRNRNHLGDAYATGTVSNIAAYIGEAALDATTGEWTGKTIATPVALTLSAASLTGSAEITSNWVTPDAFPITAYKKLILSLGFSTTASDQISVGGGAHWYTFNRTDAALAAPALSRAENQGLLQIWVEYEFADDSAPIIMVVSNSISGGGNVGSLANRGELDSWGKQWAMAHGGVVADISVGGAWANQFGAASPRWNHYNTLATALEPDAVVFMGTSSSDISGTDGSAGAIDAAKTAMIAAIKKAQALWPGARIILSTNPPRGASTAGAVENARITMNEWLTSSPAGADQCIDLEPPLTDGAVPARLHPLVLVGGGDTDHWRPRGHSRVAKLIPVTRADDEQSARIALADAEIAWAARFGSHKVPAARSTFFDKANTAYASLLNALDTGQAIGHTAVGGTNAQPRITNGLWTIAGGGDLAGYDYTTFNDVNRIGIRGRFGSAGSTDNGVFCIAFMNQPGINTSDTAFRIGAHLIVTPVYCELSKVSLATGTAVLTSLGLWSMDHRLLTDGVTEYEVEMYLVGNTITAILPDGQVKVVTDTDIGTWSDYAFYEVKTSASTDHLPGISEVWMDTGVQYPPSSKPITREDLKGTSWRTVKESTASVVTQSIPQNVVTDIADLTSAAFIAPLSGKVLATVQALVGASTSSSIYVGVRWTGFGTGQKVQQIAAFGETCSVRIPITGLTPGQSYQIVGSIFSSGADTVIYINPPANQYASLTVEPVS